MDLDSLTVSSVFAGSFASISIGAPVAGSASHSDNLLATTMPVSGFKATLGLTLILTSTLTLTLTLTLTQTLTLTLTQTFTLTLTLQLYSSLYSDYRCVAFFSLTLF